MVLLDYKCDSCGTIKSDVLFRKSDDITPQIACKCGEQARRLYSGGNHIHATKSSLYGNYEPALGMVVESYSHKQRLMREFSITEANDPVKGSRNDRSEPHKAIKQRSAPDQSKAWISSPNDLPNR